MFPIPEAGVTNPIGWISPVSVVGWNEMFPAQIKFRLSSLSINSCSGLIFGFGIRGKVKGQVKSSSVRIINRVVFNRNRDHTPFSPNHMTPSGSRPKEIRI